MSALHFFTVTKTGRDMHSRDQHWLLGELCDVMIYPRLTENAQEALRKHYFDRAISDQESQQIERFRQQAQMKAKEIFNQKPLSGDDAKYSVMELFSTKRRLEYGR